MLIISTTLNAQTNLSSAQQKRTERVVRSRELNRREAVIHQRRIRYERREIRRERRAHRIIHRRRHIHRAI
jgi:hypothetical protein